MRTSEVPMCDHRRSLSVYGTNNLHCERHGVGPSNRGHGGSPPGAVKLRSSRLSQPARCRCGVAGDRTATVCNASSILTQPPRDTRRPARNGCNVSRAWGGGEDTRPPARSNFRARQVNVQQPRKAAGYLATRASALTRQSLALSRWASGQVPAACIASAPSTTRTIGSWNVGFIYFGDFEIT